MSDKIYDVLKGKYRLWKTPGNLPYVDIKVENIWQVTPVRSTLFKGWISKTVFEATGKIPSTNTVSAFIDYCCGTATLSGIVHDVNIRIASFGEALFYDLGNYTAIKVTGEGWSSVDEFPVRFFLGNGLPQIKPKATGKTLPELLSPFIATRNREDLLLLCSWLVGALKPGGPFPILFIHGEQGSAKSTTTRLLGKLIDPHSRDMREPPTNERDLVAAAKNAHVLAFDNVSKIPNWFSDALCGLATGTRAIGGRALYTDSEEASFVAARPMILNGIPLFVEREDLQDRAISINLPAIPPDKRKDDDTFWAEFEAAKPEILGALFNCVARALKNFKTTELTEKPRMSNFAKWVVASGLDAEFMGAYMANRFEAVQQQMEDDEFIQAILQIVKEVPFVGTYKELMIKLLPYAPMDNTVFWPRTMRQVRNVFLRVKPNLREMGIMTYHNGREGGTGRTRIEIRKTEKWGRTGHAVSAAS